MGNQRVTGVSPVRGWHGMSDPTQGRGRLRVARGAYLPHWTREEATYFVTFRLHDSLPKDVLKALAQERDEIRSAAQRASESLRGEAKRRAEQVFSKRIDKLLAAGHGECWLARPEIARLVRDALSHFAEERYEILAWCVMPNHVHVVLTVLPGHMLGRILHSWKSYTAHEANRMLGRTGPFWRDESFDHIVRHKEDL